jgi:WD40 repeat protein
MSTNGKLIYSSSADGTIKVWNLESRITNTRQ